MPNETALSAVAGLFDVDGARALANILIIGQWTPEWAEKGIRC